jgi:hypothetical protein
MKEIEENLSDITGRRSDKLQLAREALMLSNRNSRITMELFLVQDRAQTGMLLATRAENTKTISELVAEITSRCESEKEKQGLSAVKGARQSYIDSYLRAIHLLVDEREHDAAVAVMINYKLLSDDFRSRSFTDKTQIREKRYQLRDEVSAQKRRIRLRDVKSKSGR